ncbi:MAG: hypothetical protein IJ757_05230 [Clostridiales bacterium]|nr:hypothetical protein [Clostridiales bacterium]
MEVINGEWMMEGVDWDDPSCVHTAEELLEIIEKVGFLPLFANEVPGFSVENITDPSCWWCGDPSVDPWEWRGVLARTGKVAYGKFFRNKAGFVSKKWFPEFANYRRDGYNFDSLYEEGKADARTRVIMDLFWPSEGEIWDAKQKVSLYSNDVKERAGFGKGGLKNFDGTCAKLQMMTYLVAQDFRPRKNKSGEEYGWAVAVYTMPEYLWGYKHVTKCYKDSPDKSRERIIKQIAKYYDAEEAAIARVIRR